MDPTCVTEKKCVSQASQKPINRPGWWKGKLALVQMPATEGGGGRIAVQRPPPPPTTPNCSNKQGVRAFIDRVRGRGYVQKQHSQLTVTFKLVTTGLTSLILVALSTVNLRFQGPFAPISLRSVLRIMAASVLSTV